MSAVAKYLAYLIIAAAVIGAAMILFSGPGTRFEFWDFGIGLRIMIYGLFAVLGALAGAVVWGLLRIFTGPSEQGGLVAIAAIIAVIAGAYPLYQINVARAGIPPIHDITTDMVDPPKFVAVLPLRAAKPDNNPPEYEGSKIADQQRAAYPDIQPIMSQKPPAELFASAVRAADDLGWEVVDKNPIEGRIEATATSFWFGFKDDIVIRIRPEGTGSRLDIRSKSRVGIGDVGANAARIRAFRDKLGS
jgi:uncharacterized protein (DUF1499 family)